MVACLCISRGGGIFDTFFKRSIFFTTRLIMQRVILGRPHGALPRSIFSTTNHYKFTSLPLVVATCRYIAFLAVGMPRITTGPHICGESAVHPNISTYMHVHNSYTMTLHGQRLHCAILPNLVFHAELCSASFTAKIVKYVSHWSLKPSSPNHPKPDHVWAQYQL